MQSGDCAIRLSRARRNPREDLGRKWTVHSVLFDGDNRFRALDQRKGSGFVTQGRIRQRELAHESPIFWLFIEKRFQLALGLSPSLLGGGVISGNFLCPA